GAPPPSLVCATMPQPPNASVKHPAIRSQLFLRDDFCGVFTPTTLAHGANSCHSKPVTFARRQVGNYFRGRRRYFNVSPARRCCRIETELNRVTASVWNWFPRQVNHAVMLSRGCT